MRVQNATRTGAQLCRVACVVALCITACVHIHARCSCKSPPGFGFLEIIRIITVQRYRTRGVHIKCPACDYPFNFQCERDRRGRPQGVRYTLRTLHLYSSAPRVHCASHTVLTWASLRRGSSPFDVVPCPSAHRTQRPLRPLPSPRTTAIGPYNGHLGPCMEHRAPGSAVARVRPPHPRPPRPPRPLRPWAPERVGEPGASAS